MNTGNSNRSVQSVNPEKSVIQTYAAYKDSGVDWLGDVPEHWELLRLSAILTEITQRNTGNFPLLSITREKGVILRDTDNDEENHNFIPDDLSNYKILRAGQFGMNKMKAWQGSYGISNFDGIVSPAYFVFKVNQRLLPNYFHLLIRSKVYVSMFGAASDGVRVGQWDLSKVRMRSIPIPIPPLPEQTAIADFLDRKCALIDKAIAIKEKQITLLKERRQILIQNAVTRGLNPNVKMKDSGVDWIGEIPEHWEVKRLKFIADLKYGLGQPPKEKDDGLPLIRATNVERGMINENDLIFVDPNDVPWERNPQLKENDIIVVRSGAYTADSAIITKKFDGAIAGYDMVVRAFGINPNFLAMALLSSYVLHDQLFLLRMRAAQPHLNIEELGDTVILIPTAEEQASITFHLISIGNNISKATNLLIEEIEKLKEYKTCLINEAVTGKIKVC